MAPRARKRTEPIRGRALSPCRRTLMTRNLAVSTAKTRIPRIECRATLVGVSGPAGPTRHVRATTTARVRARRPLTRWTRTAAPGLTAMKRGRPQNRAAIATCSPARANTMLVSTTFQSRRWPPVMSLRNLIMGGSLRLSGQDDLGVHAWMDRAPVLEGLLHDEAERLAGGDRPRVDLGIIGRDIVRRHVLVLEGDLAALGGDEGLGVEGDLGHDDGVGLGRRRRALVLAVQDRDDGGHGQSREEQHGEDPARARPLLDSRLMAIRLRHRGRP